MKSECEFELSIVAPMFNEADNIERTVSLIKEEMKRFNGGDWELIFVDDGSTDESLAKAEEMRTRLPNLRVVSYARNAGRGKALRTGIEAANGRFIVTVDFDLSYSPDHILAIYDELKSDDSLDIVLASPYMPGGRVENVPFKRLLVSRIGNAILRLSFSSRFHTVTSITRGYRRSAAKSLVLESEGKEIHLEILSKALAIGLNCKEIPAVLRGREKGKSKFRFARTSITHLIFSLFERPAALFLFVGAVCLAVGVAFGCYIIYLRFTGALTIRPLTDLVVLLTMLGIQFISFGVLAGQNGMLRKEIYKLQSQLRRFASTNALRGKDND